MNRLLKRLGAAAAACLVCLGFTACGAKPAPDAAVVLVDGQPWTQARDADAGGLRVYVTLDGEALIDLPFGQAHSVAIAQADGSENTVAITADAVYMASANCENQDCVHMGEVTRDNLEYRVMGGFIICLPHRLSVEVRGE